MNQNSHTNILDEKSSLSKVTHTNKFEFSRKTCYCFHSFLLHFYFQYIYFIHVHLYNNLCKQGLYLKVTERVRMREDFDYNHEFIKNYFGPCAPSSLGEIFELQTYVFVRPRIDLHKEGQILQFVRFPIKFVLVYHKQCGVLNNI